MNKSYNCFTCDGKNIECRDYIKNKITENCGFYIVMKEDLQKIKKGKDIILETSYIEYLSDRGSNTEPKEASRFEAILSGK